MSDLDSLIDTRETITKHWAGDIARGTDGIIGKAILLATGTDWHLIDVPARCKSVRFKGDKFVTISLDGEPILELHDVTFDSGEKDGKYFMTALQNYRFLGKAARAHGSATAPAAEVSGEVKP